MKLMTHLLGCMADRTKMRVATSMLASGKGKGSLEVTSHWKAWQRDGSYRGCSWEGEGRGCNHSSAITTGRAEERETLTICTADAAKSQQ